MNTNELRAAKRNRNWEHIIPTDAPHIMMKNESKLMRRLQSDTGMMEEEVRNHKKYRKMLSDEATAEGPGVSDTMRYAKRILKSITKELKLAKAHPLVVEQALTEARKYDNTRYGHYSYWGLTGCMKTLLTSRRKKKK